MHVLTCPRCGAPLPKAHARSVTCGFCTSNVSLDTGVAADVSAAVGVSPEGAAFCQALAAELGAGKDPFASLTSLARTHLGVFGESDALARVTIAIARDFETESGVSILRDGTAMSRIAGAYLLAMRDIREKGAYELNLPFIAAASDGPKHLARRLDAATVASLAARDPSEANGATGASGGDAPKKKKGFWPFG